MTSVLVVGAGIGGIAVAGRLARKGYDVTVLEKNAVPGGRLNKLLQDGHRFDVGPSLFLMPQTYAATYAALGEIHKPIGFPGLTKWTSNWDPTTINYWVAYWIAAYNYVLEHRNIIFIISYEQTCLNPTSKLPEICEQLEIDTEGMLSDIAALFHHPPQARADLEQIDPTLRENAKILYYRLLNN